MPRLLLALTAAIALSALPQPEPSPQDLAKDLQRKYEQIQDFSADFEHAYEGGVLRKKITERGTVIIRKPGMMRWTYTWPEKKEFVSDGRKMYSYMPEDRQVIVSAVPPGADASSPALFLAGRGNIARDFVASTPAGRSLRPDELALQLVPKEPQAEYDRLVLVVARGTLQLRRLETTDAQGGTSSMSFSRFRENVRLPDSAFAFRIPRGVEVIDESRPR